MQMLSEAINDLTIALKLDETISQAYAYRGQCHYWMNNTKQAFADYQKLIQSDSKNALVHV
jgi:tetratricopeptide (TPR) repeat protein